MAALGDDLYFFQSDTSTTSTPKYRIVKCPNTGCTSSNEVTIGAPLDLVTDIQVDNTGVYWIAGNSIQACALSGCVGGPIDVATQQNAPSMLRLNTSSVYWVNTGDNTIRRVTKPMM
jgi:hypothetical protein